MNARLQVPLRPAVEVARSHKAKLHQDPHQGWWRVLDENNTILWWAFFASEDHAARAWCLSRGYRFKEEGQRV
jgi:hypothetical protein